MPASEPWIDESGELDRDIVDAVEFYLEGKTARRDDEDYEEYKTSMVEFDRKVGELIWQCRKENQLPDRQYCFSNCNMGVWGPC